MFACSLHKGIIAKGESSCYLPKVLALGQKLVLGKPSNCTQVGEVVYPPTSTFVYLSQDSHNEICNMINTCIYNHPFKVFMNRKHEGVEDLVCAMLERPIDSGDFSCGHGFDEVLMK